MATRVAPQDQGVRPVYAQKHGYGYVEAAGVMPPERDGET
jgi:hypothetical protein